MAIDFTELAMQLQYARYPMLGYDEVLRRKPTDSLGDYMYETFGKRIKMGGAWGRPKPAAPKPKEKSEIDLYLERIGYVK